MFDVVRIAVVFETLGQPGDDIASVFKLPEQLHPGIEGDGTPSNCAVTWRPARRLSWI
jgi:hypothetical protein